MTALGRALRTLLVVAIIGVTVGVVLAWLPALLVQCIAVVTVSGGIAWAAIGWLETRDRAADARAAQQTKHALRAVQASHVRVRGRA